MSDRTYRTRLADPLIADLGNELPALMLIGPRATGKTTTAARHAKTILRLDRSAVAAAVRADPDAVLRDLEGPILIDEWQVVPEVLGAVKRAVDTGVAPGRFLLTGSVRARMKGETWPGTGRVVPVPLSGLTVREMTGDADSPSFFDRLTSTGTEALRSPTPVLDLRDYVELALLSGFPEPALNYSDRARKAWLAGYIDQVVHRDAQELDGPRDPRRLRRFLEAIAVNSAGTVADATLSAAAGIDRRTATAYERLLQDLLIVEVVPAWSTQRLKRLARSPKRYLCDPSLITSVLGGVDVNGVLTDSNILGRLLDTFVATQLRAEVPVSHCGPRLYHLRQDDGRREIDLVVETAGQRIIGIEIKATSTPTSQDARHLTWLRDTLGDRFVLGLLLHTGPYVFRLDDDIMAAPISVIWT